MPNPNITKWTFHPPPGVRFVNELGSEVTCVFESGTEPDLFVELTSQLQQHYNTYLLAEAAKTEVISRVTIDVEGNIHSNSQSAKV